MLFVVDNLRDVALFISILVSLSSIQEMNQDRIIVTENQVDCIEKHPGFRHNELEIPQGCSGRETELERDLKYATCLEPPFNPSGIKTIATECEDTSFVDAASPQRKPVARKMTHQLIKEYSDHRKTHEAIILLSLKNINQNLLESTMALRDINIASCGPFNTQ